MKKNILLLSLALMAGVAHAQTWIPVANFPGDRASSRKAGVSVLVGTKAYIGLGVSLSLPYTVYKDFWRYDVTSKAWTRMADFPGTNRYDAVAFVIGTNIYVGGGDENIKTIELNTGFYRDDFYVFNTLTNTWSQIANFPDSRGEAIAFTINGKGYVACGNTSSNGYKHDMYCYDPATGVWTGKADLPAQSRAYPVGFVINNKGYLGGGYSGGWLPCCGIVPTYFSDFWQYDPATNQWTSKGQTYNGVEANGRIAQSVGLSTCDKGYLISGNYVPASGYSYPECCSSVVSEYDPVNNTWTKKTAFPSPPGALDQASGWQINGTLFAGLGRSATFYSLSFYTISGQSLVCSTGSYSTTGLPSGSNVVWSSNNGGLSINSITGAATRQSNYNGYAIVTATVSGNCNATLTKQVYVGIPPLPGPISVDATSCPEYYFYTSCVPDQGISSYTWQYNILPSGPITSYPNRTCNSPRITLTPSGATFRVGVQSINACGPSLFSTINVTVSCGGGHSVIIAPNPAPNTLTLELVNVPASDDATDVIEEVKLKNEQGIIVAESNDRGAKITLSVSNVPKGTYYLYYIISGQGWVERILIEH